MLDYKDTGNTREVRRLKIQQPNPHDGPQKVIRVCSEDIFASLRNSIKLYASRSCVVSVINDPVVETLSQLCAALKKSLDRGSLLGGEVFPFGDLMDILFGDGFNELQKAGALKALSLAALNREYPANVYCDSRLMDALFERISSSSPSALREESFHFIGVMSLIDDTYASKLSTAFLRSLDAGSVSRGYLFACQASMLYSDGTPDLDFLLGSIEESGDTSILIDSFYVIGFDVKKSRVNMELLFEEVKYLFSKNIREDEMRIVRKVLCNFDTLPFGFLDILFLLLESNDDHRIHFYVFRIIAKFSFYWRQYMRIEHLQKLLFYASNDPFLASSECIICLSAYYIPGLDDSFDVMSLEAFMSFLNSNPELKESCLNTIISIVLFHYQRDHNVALFEPYLGELLQTVSEMLPMISDNLGLQKSCFCFIRLFRLISEDFDRS